MIHVGLQEKRIINKWDKAFLGKKSLVLKPFTHSKIKSTWIRVKC